jgi:hypothetical protein
MPRFSSMKYAPAETRRILRDRFVRYLPVSNTPAMRPSSANLVPDELLLNLLLNLNITFESDVDRARASYDAALAKNSGEPSFDQAAAEGWFRIVWGRITAPYEVDQRARAAPAETMTALQLLLKNRFGESFVLSDSVKSDPALASIASRIECGDTLPGTLRSQDPEWVAARLWDRALTDTPSHASTLRGWVDRWRLLGWPSLVANKVWSEAAADAFRETALGVLASEPGLAGWAETRDGFVRQISLRTGQPAAVAWQHIAVVPTTLLDRTVWLEDRRLEGAVANMISANQDLVGLIRLLLTDVEEQEFVQVPPPVFRQLIELAVERPEILAVVLFRVRWSAALLADLLLYPATCALASWLIAQWPGPSGAWDRELKASDDQSTKAMAFADAVAVVCEYLEKALLPPAEAASLLDALYKTAKPIFSEEASDESILAILRGEITAQAAAVQEAIFVALSASMPASGLGSSTFAAALDVVDAADLGGTVDPAPLINSYVSSVVAGAYGLSANRISVSAAASLVKLAMKVPDALRQAFFAPIDVRARMATANAPDANPFTIEDEIARSVRVHVRILCRAVAGLEDSSPNELTEALIKTVRIGALKHDEKGRVGAFAARFETHPFRGAHDRSVAVDLAAALSALPQDQGAKLLAAILEIDEPIILARLITLTPPDARAQIESRVDTLTPIDAGGIRSLPEAMVRIEELLNAGRADAATKFIEAERGLRTMGPVAGRDLTRLRIDLHLKLLRRDWAGLATTDLPADLVGQARDTALDLINFFKGFAALSDPNGNREGAENFFTALHSRHPHVAAYAVNLFAARISALLGTDMFAELQGPKRVRGRQILAEAEQASVALRDASDADLEVMNCNEGLLLLALGQPDRAYDVLASRSSGGRLRDNAAAFAAVALNRMARVREALAVLDDAEKVAGETKILREAREYIKSGKHFAAVVSLATDDKPISRIRTALFDLSQLDHHRQAEVLVEASEPFESLVIKHVRAAAESVMSLVSLTKFAKTDLYENEITALIRMPLAASIRFLGWTVPYLSPGGYSARGNTGERDLVIEKNGSTIAVIEAIACRNPTTYKSIQDDLIGHFKKLFGYSSCAFFVYLAYSYVDDPSVVLSHLKPMAEKEAPPSFSYTRSKNIPLTDSGPTGFVAEYQGSLGPVKVLFLVLDMRQYAQEEAARIAGNR